MSFKRDLKEEIAALDRLIEVTEEAVSKQVAALDELRQIRAARKAMLLKLEGSGEDD